MTRISIIYLLLWLPLAKPASAQIIKPFDSLNSAIKVLAPTGFKRDSIAPGQIFNASIPDNYFRPFAGDKKIDVTGENLQWSYIHTNIDDMESSSLQGMADLNATLFSVPLTVFYDAGSSSFNHDLAGMQQFTKVNFDREQYLKNLQSAVLKHVDPNMVLASLTRKIQDIQHRYEMDLKRELKSWQVQFLNQYGKQLKLPDSLANLSEVDINAIRSKLFVDDGLQHYNDARLRYEQLERQGDNNHELKDSLLASIKGFETRETIFKRILDYKSKLETNPIISELRSHLPFNSENFASYLQKPENLKQVLSANTQLNIIQEVLMNITRANGGANPVNTGPLSLNDLQIKGLDLGYKPGNSELEFITGKSNGANQWLQRGLTSSVLNEFSSMTHFSLATSTQSGFSQNIGLSFFNFESNNDVLNGVGQAKYLPAPSHKDAVITWQSSYQINEKNTLKADVSRSFGSYENDVERNSVASGLLSSQGKANYAATVSYSGEVLQSAIAASVRKVGMGYSNPGNYLLRQGETAWSFMINRNVGKNLKFNYAIESRVQDFDPLQRFHFSSLSNKMQLGYRFKKNNRISLTYQSINSNLSDQTKSINYRLQLDGTYQFKIASRKLFNTLSIMQQGLNMPVALGNHQTVNWLFSSSTSMPLHKNAIVYTLTANHALSGSDLYTASFLNNDVSYSYQLSDLIRASSCIGFYCNYGWNRQIGYSQQLTATILKSLSVDFEVRCKKAIQITKVDFADQFFMSSYVKFHF